MEKAKRKVPTEVYLNVRKLKRQVFLHIILGLLCLAGSVSSYIYYHESANASVFAFVVLLVLYSVIKGIRLMITSKVVLHVAENGVEYFGNLQAQRVNWTEVAQIHDEFCIGGKLIVVTTTCNGKIKIKTELLDCDVEKLFSHMKERIAV